jgi:ABC-2 type transport system ATP-binding protein
MYARLGFSCAIDIDPDVLLIDEILSVGDERSNTKCRGVFERFLNERKTRVHRRFFGDSEVARDGG